MNPNYTEFKFPQIKPHPWHKVFRSRTSPETVDFISQLLQYDPKTRPSGIRAVLHKYFDDLRLQETMISSSKPLPDLLNFSKEELALMDEEMKVKLIPEWYVQKKKTEEPAKSAPTR
mmetsp:Transcript_79766/g.146710  ORF Transcript_79766/g.146710 Transcript_79766/m.146710 type:complete len:117 (+) Transcript_79766:2-352(+)